MITADQRRGTLDLNYTKPTPPSTSTGLLKLEWKDRRTNATVDSLTIFPEDGLTYQKVDTGREGDRVYLLEYGSHSDRRYFFWMQDKLEGNLDEDNCVMLNTYLADPKSAEEKVHGEPEEGDSPSSSGGGEEGSSGAMRLDMNGLGGGGMDNAALMQIMSNLGPDGTASTREGDSSANSADATAGGGSAPQGQVDALSNILENLGMPQPSNSTSSESTTTNSGAASTDAVVSSTGPTAASTGASATSGLTLSDLQGAMAGLATTSPTNLRPTPPLNTLITPHSISTILLSDESIKSKLVSLLPEGQQTTEFLEENLRSPQVAQCLKSISAALADEGMDGFHSIMANFQLDPKDGQEALVGGNPIQAFLDSVLKKVERERGSEEGAKEEEKSDADEEMKD